MKTISIIIIVKNAEDFLENALKSASWADEIIILDSGSTDRTLSIAKKYTQNIHVWEKWQGFGLQRQRAQKIAKSDWIFMLDADEVITKELKLSIQKVMQGAWGIYQVNRLSKAFGKEIKHSGWHPDWITRLYPKKLTTYNDDLVHEKLIIPSDYVPNKIDGLLMHETYRTMSDYYEKMTLYIDAWSTSNLSRKRGGLIIGLLRGFWAFINMYILRLGLLDGSTGLTLALLRSETTIMKYVDLKVKQKNKFKN
ncbi:MAG: glycosyltransferase family 2 protein [Pseudomonadota bacterium]|nr:glycosyltransferase family 2 protein [Pseudomonadota bacterium]|tara:strand:+ start:95 stop:853 length:759 start_codon:yes stop_codon:yes gene_type:complete